MSKEEVSKFPFLVQAILTVIGMSAVSTTTAVQLIRRGVPGSSRTLVSVSAITETDGGGTEKKEQECVKNVTCHSVDSLSTDKAKVVSFEK